MQVNHIYNEDCLSGMRRIAEKSIDMIICDLPYGTTENKWDSIIPLDSLWKEYERIIKDDGAIVLTAQTPFDKLLGVSNMKLLRYEWIWEKTSPTGHFNANKMPMKAHENILVFYKKMPVYHPQKTFNHKRKVSTAEHGRNSSQSSNYNYSKKSDYDSTERYPRSVQVFATDKQTSNLHPTQKPVALFEFLIKTYTNPGDLVLDNCMGSGTTAIACINLERQYLGFETDERYYELSLHRITSHQQQLTLI